MHSFISLLLTTCFDGKRRCYSSPPGTQTNLILSRKAAVEKDSEGYGVTIISTYVHINRLSFLKCIHFVLPAVHTNRRCSDRETRHIWKRCPACFSSKAPGLWHQYGWKKSRGLEAVMSTPVRWLPDWFDLHIPSILAFSFITTYEVLVFFIIFVTCSVEVQSR